MIVLLVAVGAVVGAPLRYLVDRAVQARHDSLPPWGTFRLTPPGRSCSVGWSPPVCIPGAGNGCPWAPGCAGALSTYSTFGYETVRLLQDCARAFAVINAAASIIAGLRAGSLGAALAQVLTT